MREKIIGAITKLNSAAAFLSGFAVLLISLMYGVEAFSRNLFNRPLEITSSLPQFFMIYVVFLGSAYCLQQGGHIRIEIILDKLNNHYRRIFNFIGYSISALFIGVLLWKGVILTLRSYAAGWQTFTTIQVPIAFINAAIPLGSILMLLALLIVLIQQNKANEE